MKLIVLHSVWPTLLESTEWYEMECAGIGAAFMWEVSSILKAIAENPFRFPKIYRDARRAQVGRFPFGAFYVLKEDTIYVFAIVHLQRRPRQWMKQYPRKRRNPPKETS